MSETFSETEVMAELREAIEDAGSQKAFAEKAGVSTAYVNDMFLGKRPIGGRVLTLLGFERRSVIVAIPPASLSPENNHD